MITVSRSSEKLKIKCGKVVADIKHIKTCKKGHLIQTFTKVNISIINKTQNIERKNSLFMMNPKLGSKHSEKRKLKEEIRKIT